MVFHKRYPVVLATAAALAFAHAAAFAQETEEVPAPVGGGQGQVAEAAEGGDAEDVKDVADAADAADAVAGRWAHYLEQGGKTMWFLGLLSVLGLGCALERLICLRRSRIISKGLADKVAGLWKEGRMDEIRDLVSRDRSALARVIESIVEYGNASDVLEIKAFAEDKAGRELRLEGRKAGMLATVATLAPLLGLFGTVLGLLEAFGTVAAMGEMGDASILADSIGKALVTTVAGLAVAMPALFIHQIVRNRLSLYAVMLEEEIADVLRRTVGAGR